MDPCGQVGRNVKAIREASGLSQEEVASRARLDRTYISGIERGKRNPTVLALVDIASAMSVQLSDLIKGIVVQPADRSRRR